MPDDVVGIGPVPQIELVPGSLRKVCQLTGEWDRQRHTPAHNRTETRFGPRRHRSRCVLRARRPAVVPLR